MSILAFAFLHVVPGDPIDHLAGGEATPEHAREARGVPGPGPGRFRDSSLTFLGHIVDGTLGHQCPDPEDKPTVAARIVAVLPHTLALALAGMSLAAIVAIPLGVLAAVRRGTWIDTP